MLLVAAAAVLGGAERVLLDWAGALERPACSPARRDRSPTRPRAAGLDVVALRGAAAAPARAQRRARRCELAALARDVARLARRQRPAVVVASGQRPLLAAAWTALGGARLLALQQDLPPGASTARLLRAASARAERSSRCPARSLAPPTPAAGGLGART